ncbi:MAG TPA: hypothetical protein VGO84_16760 [Burkholderiales bacterium]|nr:hypothetical protein [Burkholderiales bacterium]
MSHSESSFTRTGGQSSQEARSPAKSEFSTRLVRKAPDDKLILADGASCWHWVHDGVHRAALYVAACWR